MHCISIESVCIIAYYEREVQRSQFRESEDYCVRESMYDHWGSIECIRVCDSYIQYKRSLFREGMLHYVRESTSLSLSLSLSLSTRAHTHTHSTSLSLEGSRMY